MTVNKNHVRIAVEYFLLIGVVAGLFFQPTREWLGGVFEATLVVLLVFVLLSERIFPDN